MNGAIGQTGYPRELTMYGSIPYTGRVNLLWSVSVALFLWALAAAGHSAAPDGGLLLNLVHTLCLGYWTWTFVGILWLGEAKRRWSRLPDARMRYDRNGVYGLLRWQAVLVVALVGVPVASVLGLFTAHALLSLMAPLGATEDRLGLGASLVLGYSLALGTFTVDYLRVRLVSNQLRAETAQRQAVEAQLRLLQAQLEPHMLFNTLANLHALIDTDPSLAQQMLERMIAFLRAALTASQRSTHPLSAEFEQASDYLALMQIRMGQRLRVSLNLPPELADQPVPPLLLQPLLENAIQHGLEPTRRGGLLTVNAYRDGGVLLLTVTDTGRGLEAAQAARPTRKGPGGFGLNVVRERLQSMYGEQALLTLGPSPEGVGTQAVLQLPLQTTPGLSSADLRNPPAEPA